MARRGHTRIDVLLVRMPRGLQRFLNVLAMASLALFALFALWRGSSVLEQSIELQSVATNPLQTPLWQPQALWLIGLGLFAVFATAYAVHAVALWIRRAPQLNRFYGPASAVEELEAELQSRREKP
jgi:TRAP-type C4-dicarboxylate transport system permease small subunit